MSTDTPTNCLELVEFIARTTKQLERQWFVGNKATVRTALMEMPQGVALAVLANIAARSTQETRTKLAQFMLEEA